MLIAGMALGLLAGLVIHLGSMGLYKRLLVKKSEDGTAECINGNFYYIRKEANYAARK